MANIVTNTLAIVGSEKYIKLFKEKYLKKDFSLNTIWPEPKSRIDVPKQYIVKDNNTYHEKSEPELNWMDKHYDWYKWRTDNWGVKWDVDCSDGIKKINKNSIILSFTSPWAPPLPVIQKLIKDNPKLKIRMSYYDEFWNYSGYIDSELGIKEQGDPTLTETFYNKNNILEWAAKNEKSIKNINNNSEKIK